MAQAARRTEYMPLDELASALRNPKQHHKAGIRASVSRFGVLEIPVLDERTGRLVAGHGRRDDLADRRARGEDPPEGVLLDADGGWLVPVSRGWASRSDDEAHAAGIALNRLTELGGWDEAGVDAILADVAAADRELALVTGFDEARLDEAIAALGDGEPTVHDGLPPTDAAYAETDEERAARAERIGAYAPAGANLAGYTEMILVYSLEDRDEVGRLITLARSQLDSPDLRAAEVMLRGLRTLTVWLDAGSPARLAASAGRPEYRTADG